MGFLQGRLSLPMIMEVSQPTDDRRHLPLTEGKTMGPGLAGAMGVVLIFALLRQSMPFCAGRDDGPPLTDAERRLYHRWEMGSLVPLLLAASASSYLWFRMLRLLAVFAERPVEKTRYLILPDPGSWGVPAIFLGIITSAVPLVLLYRFLLGERYVRYIRACNERFGFDGWRVFRFMAILIVVLAAIWTVLAARSFTRFDEDEIILSQPLTAKVTHYTYAQIRAIEHRATFQAPSGAIIAQPNYVIHFDDGDTWSTRTLFRTPDPTNDESLIQFVAEQSGRQIDVVP